MTDAEFQAVLESFRPSPYIGGEKPLKFEFVSETTNSDKLLQNDDPTWKKEYTAQFNEPKEKDMSTENMIKAFKEIVDDWRKEQLELINEEEENVEMTLVNADPVCSDFDMLRKDYIISVQQLIEDSVDLDECEKEKLEKLGKKAFNDSVEEMTDFLIEKTKDKLMLLHTCGEVARNKIRNHVSKVKLLLDTATTHEEANKILVANHIYDEDGSYNPTKVCESVWAKKQIQAAAQ